MQITAPLHVADLDRPRVLYLADDRKQARLDRVWPTLTSAPAIAEIG